MPIVVDLALKDAVMSAALGRRVAVIGPDSSWAEDMLSRIIDLSLDLRTDIRSVRRKGHCPQINFQSGGRIQALSIREVRGRTADIIFACETLTPNEILIVRPMLATRTDTQLSRMRHA